MKENKGKCHLIVSSNKHISMKLDNIEIENSHCERLLGVKIDSKLNFKEHLNVIIKKARRKLMSYLVLPLIRILQNENYWWIPSSRHSSIIVLRYGCVITVV